MTVLAECPICRRKQSVKNKRCKCGQNMDTAKKSKRVRFWISFRLPGGKQRREYVGNLKGLKGNSIEDARDADSKRKVQKRENRIFDMLPESTMTFKELAEWYLGLEKVKALASYDTIVIYLRKFNRDFGNKIVSEIKPADLENHQVKRQRDGLKPKTIDDELAYVKTAIIKAFDNDKVSGDALKTFRKVKRILKKNANRRDRILDGKEFHRLHEKSPAHLKDLLTIGYWTGMRKGEILRLTWNKVDLKTRVISLEAEDVKEGKAKKIPIGDAVHRVLTKMPRSIRDNHVFLYNGKSIEKRFETALKTACKGAGVLYGQKVRGGFTFHDLRHTFVTDMRRAGVARTVTMSITGHAPKDMNDRYDTVVDEDRLEGIRQLEAYRRRVDQNVDQTPAENL